MKVKVDGYTRLCLTVIALLLTVLIVGLWAEAPLAGDKATAAQQFADPADQRMATVKVQEKTNAKLDQLLKLLTSGDVKVQLVEDKDSSPGGKKHDSPAKSK